MLPMNSVLMRFVMMCALSIFSGLISASDIYPNKLIKLVVPYPAGGGADTFARPLAQQLSARLGQSVVVENRGGAGGNISMDYVARSPADGYTLILALTPQLAVNGAMYERIPFDPIKSFTPISLLGEGPYLLLVHPSLPANTVKEFLALARAENGKLAYASSGSGSGGHMAGELLLQLTNITMTHVPYKGGGPALADVLGGHVKVIYAPAVSSFQYIQSGRLRALAVTGDKRLSSLPMVPTLSEAGVPGYDSTVWYALLAPANTPRDIINRLNTEVLLILKEPSFRAMMNVNGIEPIGSTPEGLTSYISKEIIKWTKVVKSAGIKVE